MKKTVSYLVLIILFLSCNEKAVKKPERLIEKEVMVDIIYDLSLLDAIKYNEPNTTQNYKVNPKEFIFRKYKVDSAQFAQNNIYYASDFESYKVMYDSVIKRIEDKKKILDALLKKEKKKDSLNQLKKKRIERLDSIAKAKKTALGKKDSIIFSEKKTITTKINSIKTKNAVILKKENVVN